MSEIDEEFPGVPKKKYLANYQVRINLAPEEDELVYDYRKKVQECISMLNLTVIKLATTDKTKMKDV